MNIADYIASGILESYVLDELSPSECEQVQRMAADHPEVAGELEKIEQTLMALAEKTAIKAPEHIRENLMAEIKPVVPMERVTASSWLKYSAAASIVVALGSLFMAFIFWNKWQSAESSLADMIAENQQFAENYNTVNRRLGEMDEALAIMNHSDFARIVLDGTANAPQSQATVFWNNQTEELYLSIQSMAQLAEDQQYQLWAIIDGKPVDAGLFDFSDQFMLLKMKGISQGAAAFAVTIEPKGGSENPTLDTMQVLGNV